MSTTPIPLPGGSAPPAIITPAAPPVAADMTFAPPDTGVDWRRILSAVLRFKWLILAGTIVGTGAGVAATTVLKPEY
ncbi:MAG TPA: hypothetical protein VFJ24_00755, partial [Gaiellales bacterium]|nr:hypothetical protein [Gaiellales bacterium]